MARKKSAPQSSAGSLTPNPQIGKIFNPKGKWGQVKKLAKKVQEKAKALSYPELKDLAREYNAKLPRGSKKRINLRQSGEKIAAALGIKSSQEKKSKLQPTEKKPPVKTGEAWGKTLDKVEQSKPKLSAEAKGDFRKQVKEAAKKLVADKPKVEIEKPAPKETIDGLVKVVEAKKQEIKSKVDKEKNTPDDYTKSELQRMANEAKIPGRSKLTTKQALFDALGLGKKKDEEAKKPELVAEIKKPETNKEESKKPDSVVDVKKPKKGKAGTEVEKPKKEGDSSILDTKKTSEVDLGQKGETATPRQEETMKPKKPLKPLLTSLVDIDNITSSVPRSHFTEDELEEVAKNVIASGGLAHPIILKRTGVESTEIVDGHRSYYASIKAKEIDPSQSDMVRSFIIEPEQEKAVKAQIELLDAHQQSQRKSAKKRSEGTAPAPSLMTSNVDMDNITPSVPRSSFNEKDLEKLAKTVIESGGLVRPVVVKRTGVESTEIVDGDFAYYASVKAKEIDPSQSDIVRSFIVDPRQEESVLDQIGVLHQKRKRGDRGN